MERSLEEQFGKQFEKSLTYLLLSDSLFAEQVLPTITTEIINCPVNKLIIDTVQSNSADNFSSVPSVSTVKNYLREQYNKNKVNRPKEAEQYKKCLSRVISLFKTPPKLNPADIEYLQSRLESFITYKQLQTAFLTGVELLEEERYSEIQEIIDEAIRTAKGRMLYETGLDFNDVDERLKLYNLHNTNSKYNVPTGIPTLDKAMRGGLEPGTLGFFSGGPGMGKSMALINVGVAALLKGLNVLHITLEISKEDTALRYDARMLGYPINEILNNISKYEPAIRSQAKKLKGSLVIEQWLSDEKSVADVRAFVKTLEVKKRFKPDVIVVDYADHLKANRNYKEERFRLRDIVRSLRNLAVSEQVPVWTATQINKEGMKEDVTSLHALSESNEKAITADVVVALCASPSERKNNRMRMVILKNRLGGKEQTSIDCKVDVTVQLIKEIPNNSIRKLKTRKK